MREDLTKYMGCDTGFEGVWCCGCRVVDGKDGTRRLTSDAGNHFTVVARACFLTRSKAALPRTAGQWVSLLSLASMLLLATPILCGQPAQPQRPADTPSSFGQRFDGFLWLLAQSRHELADLSDWENAKASDYRHWLVIAIGRPFQLDTSNVTLAAYLANGGRLLVATEQNSVVLNQAFGLGVSPTAVVTASNDSYRGIPECPLVTSLGQPEALFAGVQAIAFNRPRALSLRQRTLRVAARFPPTGGRTSTGLGLPAIAVGEFGSGRIVALGDPSVFSNEMMLDGLSEKGQGGNARFARNVLDWLAPIPNAPADSKDIRQTSPVRRLLVLMDGEPLTSLVDERFVKGDWAGPSLSDLIRLTNDTVVALEDDNVFNQAIQEWQQSLAPNQAALASALALPVALAFLLFAAWWRLRRGWSPHPPDRASLPTSTGLAARRVAQADINRFDETLGRLAQELEERFRVRGLSLAESTQWTIRAGWFARRRLRGLARDAANYAAQTRLPPATPRRFRRALRRLRQLQSALDAGQIGAVS